MKKTVALLLTFLMLFTFIACADKSEDANAAENSSANADSSANTSSEYEKIVNGDGEEFTYNPEDRGEIISNGEGIGGSKINLAGDEYSFPMKISELFDNGWGLHQGYEYQTEFQAMSKISLVSFYLVHENGSKIHLLRIMNDSAESKNIKDCTLLSFSVDKEDLKADSNCIVPGGINFKSKAADTISVFGNPNKTTEFIQSYNSGRMLVYNTHIVSGIAYKFNFEEDSLYSMTISAD